MLSGLLVMEVLVRRLDSVLELALVVLRSPWDNSGSVHLVNLLQSQTLGLIDKEEDKEDRECKTSREDVTVSEVDGSGDERSEEGQEEVSQPVGTSSNSHALGLDTQRVDLRAVNVGNGGPSNRKGEDEETGDSNHSLTDLLISIDSVFMRVQGGSSQRGVDDEEDEHGHGSPEQTLSSSESVDDVERGKSGDKVDGTKDHGSSKRVLHSNCLENGGSVVEEVVCTTQLLEGLDGSSNKQSVTNSGLASENLTPSGRSNLTLVLNGSGDLVHGLLDQRVVTLALVDEEHSLEGLLVSVTGEQESRRLRHEDSSDEKNQRPGKAQTKRDSVGTSVISVVSSVAHTVTDKDTEGDEQLEGSHQGSSNFLGSSLRLEHGADDRQTTNTNSSNDSTDKVLVPLVHGGNLNKVSHNVDSSSDHDTPLSSVGVSDSSRRQTSNGGTNGEDSYQQTGSDLGQVVSSIIMLRTEFLQKLWHVNVTRNGSGIISKHKTSHGQETAQHGYQQIRGLGRRQGSALIFRLFLLIRGSDGNIFLLLFFDRSFSRIVLIF